MSLLRLGAARRVFPAVRRYASSYSADTVVKWVDRNFMCILVSLGIASTWYHTLSKPADPPDPPPKPKLADEIGRLANETAQLVDELRERRRLANLEQQRE